MKRTQLQKVANEITRDMDVHGVEVGKNAVVVEWPTPKKRPPPVAYRLETTAAWLKELAVIYRAARRGIISLQDLSRFAYAANIGASKAY